MKMFDYSEKYFSNQHNTEMLIGCHVRWAMFQSIKEVRVVTALAQLHEKYLFRRRYLIFLIQHDKNGTESLRYWITVSSPKQLLALNHY